MLPRAACTCWGYSCLTRAFVDTSSLARTVAARSLLGTLRFFFQVHALHLAAQGPPCRVDGFSGRATGAVTAELAGVFETLASLLSLQDKLRAFSPRDWQLSRVMETLVSLPAVQSGSSRNVCEVACLKSVLAFLNVSVLLLLYSCS